MPELLSLLLSVATICSLLLALAVGFSNKLREAGSMGRMVGRVSDEIERKGFQHQNWAFHLIMALSLLGFLWQGLVKPNTVVGAVLFAVLTLLALVYLLSLFWHNIYQWVTKYWFPMLVTSLVAGSIVLIFFL